MAFEKIREWFQHEVEFTELHPPLRLPVTLAELERVSPPVLRLPVTFRVYESRDFAALLDIYDLNAPQRFPPKDRKQFLRYLRSGQGGILVGELDGRVICTGGLNQCGQCLYTLCYGLIRPEYQRQGIGTTMALLRLGATAEGEPNTILQTFIFAVPTSLAFYQRLGFKEGGVWMVQEGKAYPSGAMAYTVGTARRVADALAERGVVIRGNFEPCREIVWERKEVVNERGERMLRFVPKH